MTYGTPIFAGLPHLVRYLKPWTTYYKRKIFNMTLNFDLDLSKVNNKIWHRCWTSVSHFMKIILVLSRNEKLHTSMKERMKKQTNRTTNKHAWSQYLHAELATESCVRRCVGHTRKPSCCWQTRAALLKSGSGVTQGHRMWHHSIVCIWFPITVL